jgi:hypothetical protein
MNHIFLVLVVAVIAAYCAPVAAQPVSAGSQACRAGVPKHLTFNDPESVRIGEVTGGQMEVIEYAGTRIAARRFTVPVNARNAVGVYIGEKSVICFTSEDGQRILKVELPPAFAPNASAGAR